MISLIPLSKPTPDQVNQIIRLYKHEGWWSDGDEDKDEDDMRLVSGIVSGSHLFVVAVKGEEIVGMGRAISDRISDAYIQDVTVGKDHRGNGIGTKIVNELIKRLKADGIEWIGLIAEKGSHGFYARIDFNKMPNSVPLLLQS